MEQQEKAKKDEQDVVWTECGLRLPKGHSKNF